MKLEGVNQTAFFEVTGYEFPQARNDEWDDNWLMLYGETVIDGSEVKGTAAAFTTFELSELIRKLDCYKNGEITALGWCGTEYPNFHIDITEQKILEIFFCPNQTEQRYDEIKAFRKTVTDSDINSIRKFCISALEKFPYRGKIKNIESKS